MRELSYLSRLKLCFPFLKTGITVQYKVILIQAHQLKSLEMFLFERNVSQSAEWAFNYLVKSVSGTFLAALLYLFTPFFILRHINWPWTWQTSVFDPLHVINDDLTLNWTCRGAGLMHKHIRGQQWSPCLRPGCVSDRGAALCVPACLWTAAAENKNLITMCSLFFSPCGCLGKACLLFYCF